MFLPAPGIVGSEAALTVLLEDEYIRAVTDLFNQVTTALVGIGAVEPSPLLEQSGNIFSAHELDRLRQAGAVGDILLRFFDSRGKPVDSGLEKRVHLDEPGATAQGGPGDRHRRRRAQDTAPSSARCAGRWINILITDQFTAQKLAEE